jgi:hypothetical protein
MERNRIMKRIALALLAVGILCIGAGQAMAHGPHGYGHGGHYGYYDGPAVVRPYYCPPPRVIYPPVVVHPRAYGYYVPDYPRPSYNFYYQGRGLSLGFGF